MTVIVVSREALRSGQLIKSIRQGQKRSQLSLADAVGVTQGTVARWEHGYAVPTDKHKLAIARALSIPDARVLFPLEAA